MLVEDLVDHVKSINIAIYNTTSTKNKEILIADKERIISQYCENASYILKYKENKCITTS